MYFRRWFWRNVSQHITDRRLQIEEWLEFRNYSCLFEPLPLQYPIPTHDLALEEVVEENHVGQPGRRGERDMKKEALPPGGACELDSQVSRHTSDGRWIREVTDAREKRQLP